MIWCIKTYIIASVKIHKKMKIYYPLCQTTAQLLFKSRFPKVDQHAGGKWLINIYMGNTITETNTWRKEQYHRWKAHGAREWLTHWGRVTHICVGNSTIIGSDNGLLPGRRQAIIWINAGILLIGPLGTGLGEILIETMHFHSRKCIWKHRLENMTLVMAWRTRPLQLVLSGGPVTPTPIREYNGLRGENKGPFKGQQAAASNPVMWPPSCNGLNVLKNIHLFKSANKNSNKLR